MQAGCKRLQSMAPNSKCMHMQVGAKQWLLLAWHIASRINSQPSGFECDAWALAKDSQVAIAIT